MLPIAIAQRRCLREIGDKITNRVQNRVGRRQEEIHRMVAIGDLVQLRHEARADHTDVDVSRLIQQTLPPIRVRRRSGG
jgi:hypothetical protein